MEVLSMIKQSLVTEGSNPICEYYQLVRHVGSAGPEMVWKIYDAVRIADGQEASVFVFEKRIADKLHKPRRREAVAEILRREVKYLVRFKHPKLLQVWHPLEECHESLAFATEPILASLANLLGNNERMPATIPATIKDYEFSDIEVKYGVLQVTEGLSFIHGSEQMLHGNVCPQSILVNKKGTWKLAGLGFLEHKRDGKDSFPCNPWTSKSPKMAQPDLDYIAPELQVDKTCTILSDIFSLGMVICAIYNNGRSLINADHSISIYCQQIEQLTEAFGEVAHRMPLPLVEPVEKMINRDIRYRPTAQLFSLLKYFSDPVVQCLQFIDTLDQKDMSQRTEFYSKLTDTVPKFPKKVLYQNVFLALREEMRVPEKLTLVLPPIIAMIENATESEYHSLIMPGFRRIYTMQRPMQATTYLLEKVDVILAKSTLEETKTDILPMIFSVLDTSSIQGQEAALNTISAIRQFLDDSVMRKMVLPKAKNLFYKSTNPKIRINALLCIDKLLDSIDKMTILDEVLPFLTEIQCQDMDVFMTVISIYKHMLSDKKFGLTHNLIATKVMPPLIPYTVSPGLNMEQLSTLMEVLREMLEHIDRQRRNKMKLELVSISTPQSGRPSIKMRHSIGDATQINNDKFINVSQSENGIQCNKNYLSVDYAYTHLEMKSRSSPGTPELSQRTSRLQETTSPVPQRRHSSVLQASRVCSMEDNSVVEKTSFERRRSLVPEGRRSPGIAINIVANSKEAPEFNIPTMTDQTERRRSSTQSLGHIKIPESENRSSRSVETVNPNMNRRPSFQSLGESVMQLFTSKS